MKTLITTILIIQFLSFTPTSVNADEEIAPYFKVASLDGTMEEVSAKVNSALTTGDFQVIGEYNPGNNSGLKVIAYTREDLQKITLKVKDRGALASVLKIGLVKKEDKIVVSMLNPSYLFYGYLREEAETYLGELQKVEDDVKESLKKLGNDFTGFGGSEETDDLMDYHYMAFMPYFDDPVELNEFASFAEGLNTIRKNLQAKKGNTIKVYEQVFENEKIAVFGIGIMDKEDGEAHFLPIIGEENIAAMPYEIILQGNTVTMLHGKFRFAIHWPELTMSQFMKISSTPGDVEDFLKALTE